MYTKRKKIPKTPRLYYDSRERHSHDFGRSFERRPFRSSMLALEWPSANQDQQVDMRSFEPSRSSKPVLAIEYSSTNQQAAAESNKSKDNLAVEPQQSNARVPIKFQLDCSKRSKPLIPTPLLRERPQALLPTPSQPPLTQFKIVRLPTSPLNPHSLITPELSSLSTSNEKSKSEVGKVKDKEELSAHLTKLVSWKRAERDMQCVCCHEEFTDLKKLMDHVAQRLCPALKNVPLQNGFKSTFSGDRRVEATRPTEKKSAHLAAQGTKNNFASRDVVVQVRRPFKCYQCGQIFSSYTSSYELELHVVEKHIEKRYRKRFDFKEQKCRSCGMKFSKDYFQHLASHLRSCEPSRPAENVRRSNSNCSSTVITENTQRNEDKTTKQKDTTDPKDVIPPINKTGIYGNDGKQQNLAPNSGESSDGFLNKNQSQQRISNESRPTVIKNAGSARVVFDYNHTLTPTTNNWIESRYSNNLGEPRVNKTLSSSQNVQTTSSSASQQTLAAKTIPRGKIQVRVSVQSQSEPHPVCTPTPKESVNPAASRITVTKDQLTPRCSKDSSQVKDKPDVCPPAPSTKPVTENGLNVLAVLGKTVRDFAQKETINRTQVPVKPVPEKSVPEKSVPDKILNEKSVPEKSISEKTVPEKPVLQKSVNEKSVPEKSVPEKTVHEKSVAEKSAISEPIRRPSTSCSEPEDSNIPLKQRLQSRISPRKPTKTLTGFKRKNSNSSPNSKKMKINVAHHEQNKDRIPTQKDILNALKENSHGSSTNISTPTATDSTRSSEQPQNDRNPDKISQLNQTTSSNTDLTKKRQDTESSSKQVEIETTAIPSKPHDEKQVPKPKPSAQKADHQPAGEPGPSRKVNSETGDVIDTDFVKKEKDRDKSELFRGVQNINPSKLYNKLRRCPCGKTHDTPGLANTCVHRLGLDVCFLCLAITKGDTNSILIHNKEAGHFVDSISKKVMCPFPDCGRLLDFRRGIKNHLNKMHFPKKERSMLIQNVYKKIRQDAAAAALKRKHDDSSDQSCDESNSCAGDDENSINISGGESETFSDVQDDSDESVLIDTPPVRAAATKASKRIKHQAIIDSKLEEKLEKEDSKRRSRSGHTSPRQKSGSSTTRRNSNKEYKKQRLSKSPARKSSVHKSPAHKSKKTPQTAQLGNSSNNTSVLEKEGRSAEISDQMRALFGDDVDDIDDEEEQEIKETEAAKPYQYPGITSVWDGTYASEPDPNTNSNVTARPQEPILYVIQAVPMRLQRSGLLVACDDPQVLDIRNTIEPSQRMSSGFSTSKN